jgi:predicted dehydrogenase
MKLGFIGAGSMAFEHARVYEALNCDIYAACATRDSKNLDRFCRRFNVSNRFDNWLEMLELPELQGIIVAAPPEIAAEAAARISMLKIPALIEKPGAASSSDLLISDVSTHLHIYYAYNRRYYESLLGFKSYSDLLKGFFTFDLVEPALDSKSSRDSQLKNNSVHMFDLLRFLIPEARLTLVSRNESTHNYIYIIHDNSSEPLGMLHLSFGAIRNQSITWESENLTAVLKPIEELAYANRFVVQEPTLEEPIRKYLPVYNESKTPFKIISESGFKPGFYGQGLDFLKIVRGEDHANTSLATVKDAHEALRMAEQLCLDT